MVTTTYSFINEQTNIFIDGVLNQTVDYVVTPSSTSSAEFYIGSDDPTGADNGYYFQGSLDDISIYNSALSPSSVSQLYSTTTTNAAPGLIAYWPFNNTGEDFSGNNNNGTVHNVSSIADRFGNSVGAYHFDDSTSYVSVADNQPLRLHNTDFTVNEWVNLDYYNPGVASMLVSKYSSKGTGWLWAVAGNLENPFAGIGDFNTGYGAPSSYTNTKISANNWHMVTAVYTKSQQTMNVFIDGELNHTINHIPTPDSTASAPLFIGRLNPSLPGNGYYFAGSMNEVSIYNSAISASTISQLYFATH